MRLTLLALALLLAAPALAQSDDRVAIDLVELNVRAILVADDGTLPALPPSLLDNEAVMSIEMSPAGSHFLLDARFYFESVELYESWRTSEATERMMAALQEGEGEFQARLSVGPRALQLRRIGRE